MAALDNFHQLVNMRMTLQPEMGVQQIRTRVIGHLEMQNK